jgi:hypothetical protein
VRSGCLDLFLADIYNRLACAFLASLPCSARRTFARVIPHHRRRPRLIPVSVCEHHGSENRQRRQSDVAVLRDRLTLDAPG